MKAECFKKFKAEITKEDKEGIRSDHATKLLVQKEVSEAVKEVSEAVAGILSQLEDQSKQLEDQSRQLAYLTGIVCGSMDALYPAICIALCESSVYEFVGNVISDNPSLGLIRHQMVRLCNWLMVNLRADFTVEQKDKMELKPVPAVGDDQAKIRLVLAALEGLKTFIVHAKQEDVKRWDCDGRNQIMHGGQFLEHLLASRSSTGDAASAKEYEAEVKRVKKLNADFKSAVKNRGYVAEEDLKSISTAVLEIRTLLEGKGVQVTTEKKAKKLVKKVGNAINDPANK